MTKEREILDLVPPGASNTTYFSVKSIFDASVDTKAISWNDLMPVDSLPTQKGYSVNRCPVIRRRAGTAVTELAVTLPVIVLIVFGTIEICSMIFLKQSLRICAYEGARTALIPGSQASTVQESCQKFLSSRRIRSTTVSVSPGNLADQPYGTLVTVSVKADCAANSLVPTWFYQGKKLTGEVRVMLERSAK